MKNARQAEILNIIQSVEVDTQEQLLEHLRARGFTATQATISRDMKELRLVKELTGRGGYRYTVPAREDSGDQLDRLRKIFRECVVSFDTAQNIVVIHTLPGLANAAASMLDNLDVPNLVGTLAGDDTAFLAMRDVDTALDFCREIEAML